MAPRAAVFALGAVLWEMLAGRPLFIGHTAYQTLELAQTAYVPPIPMWSSRPRRG